MSQRLNTRHKGRGFWLSGVRGTGKSTLFCQILRNHPCDHLLVFDHQGEFADRLGCFSCFTWEDCDRAWAAGKAVLFDPRKLYPGERPDPKGKAMPWGRAEAFLEWSRWTWKRINEDPFRTKLWAWDESGNSVPSHGGYNGHPARLIVEEGRVRGCDLLWATQQTNQANNQLRNQATDVFAFRHADTTAAGWLIEKGWKFEDLARLPDGSFLYKTDRDSRIVPDSVTLTGA